MPLGLSGDHIRKVPPVPIPNTVVKLSEPMIVPTSAKVGIAGFLKPFLVFGLRRVFLLPDRNGYVLGLPIGIYTTSRPVVERVNVPSPTRQRNSFGIGERRSLCSFLPLPPGSFRWGAT